MRDIPVANNCYYEKENLMFASLVGMVDAQHAVDGAPAQNASKEKGQAQKH